MEQFEIQKLLGVADDQLIQLSDTVAQLKVALSSLMEENNRLRMMNHDLQDTVSVISNQEIKSDEVVQPLSEGVASKDRLQAFYNEGIHVCHTFFGSRREQEEECIFCQSIIDGLKES